TLGECRVRGRPQPGELSTTPSTGNSQGFRSIDPQARVSRMPSGRRGDGAGAAAVVQAVESWRGGAPRRVPPHNLQAERAPPGPMLRSRDAITAAVEAHVESSDFYKPAHGHIYEAIQSLHGQGEPADPVTVAEELRRADLLDGIG